MAQPPVLEFAGLLRQLRAEARLTQEELAEAAGLSPRSVSDLERGINRTARKDTALLLAGALGLAEPVQASFVAAARGRAPAAEVLFTRRRVAGETSSAGNLPVQLSSFVGRSGELAGLAAALGASPLVTVTGPGGVGKTRLALQVAADQLPSFGDGAWLCELAAAQDAETMAQAVAAALRVRPRPGLSTSGSVVEFLGTRTALLMVLDNWRRASCAAAGGCGSWRRAGSRWGWTGSRCSGCCRCRCRPRARAWRRLPPARRCRCSSSGPRPCALTFRWARRTWPRSPRSAGGWTGSRWRSSWPQRG
jgi:transcriptional regulator with XRE-family HTH domain